MPELIQLRTRSRTHGCVAQSFLGAADLRGRVSGNCTGGTTLLFAGVRGGDIVDVEGSSATFLSFDFGNFVADPGWVQSNPGDCPQSGATCITRGSLSGTPVVKSFTFEVDGGGFTLILPLDAVADPVGPYSFNQMITLTAAIRSGFNFVNWSVIGEGQGPDLGGDNPLSLTVDRGWELEAEYVAVSREGSVSTNILSARRRR